MFKGTKPRSAEEQASVKLQKFEEYLTKEKDYLNELTRDISEEYTELVDILSRIKDLKNLVLSILNKLTEVRQRMESDINVGDTTVKWREDFQELKKELQLLEEKSTYLIDEEKKESSMEVLIKQIIEKAEQTIFEAEQTDKEWFK
jgi:hypothetical protein